MRVYVVMGRYLDHGNTCPPYEDDEGILLDLFVNEKDAKNYKAAADVDGPYGEYFIRPRELRTAWRG